MLVGGEGFTRSAINFILHSLPLVRRERKYRAHVSELLCRGLGYIHDFLLDGKSTYLEVLQLKHQPELCFRCNDSNVAFLGVKL